MLGDTCPHLGDVFLDRVRRAYKLALALSDDRGGRIWAEIDQRRAPIHAALLADTNDDLRAVFADPGSTDLFNGIDYIRHNILGVTVSPNAPVAGSTLGAATVKDHLEKAAEQAFALLPRSSRDVPFPNPFPNEFGLKTAGGVASYVAVQGVYHASLIQEAMLHCKSKSVVEIGPGMGRAAFYAFLAGITDYTTIDLPLGIVAQACFLGATLGPDKLWMYGDEGPENGRIKLLVAGQKPNRTFGVAFNSDSMIEMSLSAAIDYLRWAHRHCECFISINKRDHLFTVPDIATKWFALSTRREYQIERGYWEEVFTPKKHPSLMAWHRLAWHISKIFAARGPKRAIYSLRRRLHDRLLSTA